MQREAILLSLRTLEYFTACNAWGTMDRMRFKSVVNSIIALPLLLVGTSAAASGVDTFSLRNQHPFLHVYGLPPLQGARLEEQGATHVGITFTAVNNAEVKDTDVESIRLDGETYFADIMLRHRMLDRLELGIDVPFVKHSAGVLDDMIANWHDLFGMSNSKRTGPDNELNYFYSNDGSIEQQLSASTSGIGDVQLSAAVPFVEGGGDGSRFVTMRFSVKLPTGDSDDLHGSGAMDAALGIYAQDTGRFLGKELGYLGFAGIVALGDGDILPGKQKSAVPYGGIAASWHATDRFAITGQLQAQGAYIDSDLDELGGSSIQLSAGGVYHLPRRGISLRLALVEDLVSDATPDFAVHFAVHVSGQR